MLSLLYLLLSAGLITCGLVLWRCTRLQDALKTAAFCVWLGAYACIVNAAVFSPLIEPEMATLGINLSLYVGLPMIALVLLDLALEWQWLRATWGRIFLALAAMFELMRRAETGDAYGEFIILAYTLGLLVAIIKLIKVSKSKNQACRLHYFALGVCLTLMLASLWSFNTGFVVLWNGLTLIAVGAYLYFSASAMALVSPALSPK